MQHIHHWTETVGRWSIDAELVRLGDDWVAVVTGGDRPHLGSLGWATDAPGGGWHEFPGHRDSALVKIFLEVLGPWGVKAVLAGVHVDGPTPDDLKAVVAASEKLAHRVADFLQAR